jgi:NADH-quinone oxidoreductase subunit H
MISYELSLVLSILAIVLLSGSLNLREVIGAQSTLFHWNVFCQPVAFVLFVIASFAETNRHPFDFAECEPELVGGFHTEYSSMRFALFFIGEYCAMIVMASLTTTLFLGGPSVPFWSDAPWVLGVLAFLTKTAAFLFLFLCVGCPAWRVLRRLRPSALGSIGDRAPRPGRRPPRQCARPAWPGRSAPNRQAQWPARAR